MKFFSSEFSDDSETSQRSDTTMTMSKCELINFSMVRWLSIYLCKQTTTTSMAEDSCSAENEKVPQMKYECKYE